MATTDEILDAARKLGKLIASHEKAKQFEASVKKLQDDTDAQRTLTDYNRHLMAVGQKEQEGKPIEVEDKRKLETLQNQLMQNKVLRDFQMAQMDYLDLMRRVDEAIESDVTATGTGPAQPAASPLVNPDVTGRA